MKKNKLNGAIIVLMIALILLIVGMTAVLVGALTGRLDVSKWFNEGKVFGMKTASLQSEVTESAAGVKELHIKTSPEGIRVYESPDENFYLKEYSPFELSDSEQMTVQVKDGVLLAETAKKNRLRIFFFGEEYVEVYIPKSFEGTLRLKSSSGSIRAEETLRVQEGYLSASSGSVRIGEIVSQNGVEISTSSGSIRVGTVTSQSGIELSSSSGSIRGERLEGERLKVSTSSGSIKVNEAAGEQEYSSNSGSIHLGKTEGKISAKSTSGSIRCESFEGMVKAKSSSGSIAFESGIGGGEFNSTSGSIRVAFAQVTGNIEAASTSGGVRLEIPRDTGFDFWAKTNSGGVHTWFDDEVYEKRGEKTAAIGDGTYSVRVKTSSGSIRVE